MFIAYIHIANQREMYLYDHTSIDFTYVTLKSPVFYSQESNAPIFQHLPHPPQSPDIPSHLALNI